MRPRSTGALLPDVRVLPTFARYDQQTRQLKYRKGEALTPDAQAELHLPVPEYVHDFPNGAGRYIQGSSGYDYTLVNGEVFMDHGEHTGALAGRLLRSN